MNNYKKSNYGFTLIELMVVIAIVGIFASIALPSFARLIENNRISTATNELVSNLLYARSEALKRSNSVTMCPSTDQKNCNGNGDYSAGWIIFLDCDNDGVAEEVLADCGTSDGTNGQEVILKVREGFDDSLLINNGSDNKITFEFSGRLGSVSTFQVGTDSTPINNVVLSRVGRVRTEKVTIP